MAPRENPQAAHIRHSAARSVLQVSLFAGMIYFIAMASAHFFSFKYPVLFIFWDTVFYAYQDKIIAFCAALYAMLFYEAFADPEHVSGLAARSMFITVIGLSLVIISPELDQVLDITNSRGSLKWYWAQTAFIAVIGLWLTYWRHRAGIATTL